MPETFHDLYERNYYAKGIAICESHILTDTVFCRFREKTFEFPSNETVSLWLGIYDKDYIAGGPIQIRVSELRKLEKQLEKRMQHG